MAMQLLGTGQDFIHSIQLSTVFTELSWPAFHDATDNCCWYNVNSVNASLDYGVENTKILWLPEITLIIFNISHTLLDFC